jgi:DNA repair exonuclease SbcCD ATPase subunit
VRLLSLTVEHFRCVRKAQLRFGPGLNVLYGPNDLGKSSVAEAIRAALLLQASSRDHEAFLDWAGGGDPHVELVFESEPQRIWRVRKTFGSSAAAYLDESHNGVDFRMEARGRDVDGRLSDLLRWGLAPPGGGRGRPKGMPITFLSTALLAQQDQVAAILDQALSKDSDDSGKKRLIEALQAVAEDPLFKAVLTRVQARVDEAFSTTGRKRTGKNSPWSQVRELIRRADEYARQCHEQSQRTIAIEGELKRLRSELLERRAAVENAEAILAQIDECHQRGKVREEILGRLKDGNTRLDEIIKTLQKLENAEKDHNGRVQRAAELRKQEESRQAICAAAAQEARAVKEEVARLQSEDRARERSLRKSNLEKRRAELLSEQLQNDVLIDRIRSVEAATKRVDTEEGQNRQLTETIAELKRRHEESIRAVQATDEREGSLRSVACLIRMRAARQGIEEADKGMTQVSVWREEIKRLRSAADAVERGLAGIDLPLPAQLEEIKELDRQLETARARLSVGLYLQLRPKRKLKVSVRRDDGEYAQHTLRETPFETIANRQITLDIEDLGEITFAGGGSDSREQVDTLQKRWVREAEPVLQRVGVKALDDLISMAMETAKRSQEVQDAHRAADQIEQRVADQRDWAALRAAHERDLQAVADALGAADQSELDATAHRLGIYDLAACGTRLNLLRADRDKLTETERKLGEDLTAAKATNAEKQKALAAARQALRQARSSIDGDWQDLLPEALDKQSSLKADLQDLEVELETLSAETEKTLADAQKAQTIAEESLRAAEAELSEAQESLREAERLAASGDGELKIRREAAAKLDQSAAREAVEKIQAELNEVLPPPYAITDDMLANAREAVESARHQLREIENDIQAKRGALEHVGGEVAKQRAEDAQEALKCAREQEQDLENDYTAWDLLRNTLREAEQEEGVHLGRALGDPIAQRFSALTDRRYGPVALGPNLETHTISAAGDGRSVSSLSVGTRDQLSTIFRLSLAEQLRSAVLLDDQLTQSDAQRMLWLRDLIRQLAVNIQILVFTCRPGDYLLPGEAKSVKKSEPTGSLIRSINLAEIIERSSAASPVIDVSPSEN